MSPPPYPSAIILRPNSDTGPEDRVLPIWIGPTEAASIGLALGHQQRSRPMTHDLLATVIRSLHANVSKVLINAVKGSTFYATIYLSQGDNDITIDARPSDSIALAVRTKSPIYADEGVLSSAALPYLLNDEAHKEADMEEFREFLNSVKPEDFTGV
ncbi:MAG: bifunctional nuclease family protein [Actinomycetia bacterium]|nr:bifunctional nuclease family protein [Actinomycetes bacterium]